MKTIDEFRAHKIDLLPAMAKMPRGFGSIQQEMISWISDMTYIDERTNAWEVEKARLSRQGRWSSLGASGPFLWNLPRPHGEEYNRPCDEECFTVYAEVLHRLGYFQLARLLGPEEWHAVRSAVNDLRTGDWHCSDIVSRFGLPSLRVGARGHICLSYASADNDLGWIHFDHDHWGAGYEGAVKDSKSGMVLVDGVPFYKHPDFDDPLLRDIRVPAETFAQGLILTEFAKRIQKHVRVP
jgi:hypothetical protein